MLLHLFVILFTSFAFINNVDAAPFWNKTTHTFSSKKDAPPSIKVLIVDNSEGVLVEVKGKYNIYDPNQNSLVSARFMGKSNFMQPLQGGLKWGEEFPGVYQLAIIPDNRQITTVVDGIEYRGSIYVYDVNGRISIVNDVDLDDYVSSVLAHRFDTPRAPEAMAAAVILERTNAFYLATHAASPYWSVRADKVGYEGFGVTGRNNGIEESLKKTRYMVLSKSPSDSPTIVPFQAKLIPDSPETAILQVPSLSLDEADLLASKGMHAAQILSKTFPHTSLQITFNRDGKLKTAE